MKTVLDPYDPNGLLESWKSISPKSGLENNNFISWYSIVQYIPKAGMERFNAPYGQPSRGKFDSPFRQTVLDYL